MRVNVTAFAGILALAIALLVAACDKEQCEPASQMARSADQSADLRKAAENSVRVLASDPAAVRFRGVQVWPQAVKNHFAVCGQANVFGPSSNTYVLFVAVVTRDDLSNDPARAVTAEARVGSTVTEATKVYVDTLARCYESGGPRDILRGTAVPPMPNDMKTVLADPVPAAPGTAIPSVSPNSNHWQRRRLCPRPRLRPAPSSCARTATFGLLPRAKPYASNTRARSYECSARPQAGGFKLVTPKPVAGCTAAWYSVADRRKP